MNKLFIYIPTWNRKELLEAQINRLVIAVKQFRNVRVLVSSNGEPIEDFPFYAKVLASDSRFEFRTNPSNIGGNANILLGFVLCNAGDALWILADDNPITEQSIEIILEKLQSNWDLIGMSKNGAPGSEIVFDNKSLGLRYLSDETPWGLISSVIYNIDSVSRSIQKGFSLHNSSFPHLAILLDSANTPGGLKVTQIEEALIHQGNIFDTGSDYSLSLVGSPILFSFETKENQKNMARKWLWENGSVFYSNRNAYYQEFILTRHLLKKWCGVMYFYAVYIPNVTEQLFYESGLGRKLRKRFRNSGKIRRVYKKLGKPIHLQR